MFYDFNHVKVHLHDTTCRIRLSFWRMELFERDILVYDFMNDSYLENVFFSRVSILITYIKMTIMYKNHKSIVSYRYPFKRTRERYLEIISSHAEHGDDKINVEKK